MDSGPEGPDGHRWVGGWHPHRQRRRPCHYQDRERDRCQRCCTDSCLPLFLSARTCDPSGRERALICMHEFARVLDWSVSSFSILIRRRATPWQLRWSKHTNTTRPTPGPGISISSPQKQVWSKRHKRMNTQEVNMSTGKPEHHHHPCDYQLNLWYSWWRLSAELALSTFRLCVHGPLNSNTKLKPMKEILAKEWTFKHHVGLRWSPDRFQSSHICTTLNKCEADCFSFSWNWF